MEKVEAFFGCILNGREADEKGRTRVPRCHRKITRGRHRVIRGGHSCTPTILLLMILFFFVLIFQNRRGSPRFHSVNGWLDLENSQIIAKELYTYK